VSCCLHKLSHLYRQSTTLLCPIPPGSSTRRIVILIVIWLGHGPNSCIWHINTAVLDGPVKAYGVLVLVVITHKIGDVCCCRYRLKSGRSCTFLAGSPQMLSSFIWQHTRSRMLRKNVLVCVDTSLPTHYQLTTNSLQLTTTHYQLTTK
jgi:hypothetical protein